MAWGWRLWHSALLAALQATGYSSMIKGGVGCYRVKWEGEGQKNFCTDEVRCLGLVTFGHTLLLSGTGRLLDLLRRALILEGFWRGLCLWLCHLLGLSPQARNGELPAPQPAYARGRIAVYLLLGLFLCRGSNKKREEEEERREHWLGWWTAREGWLLASPIFFDATSLLYFLFQFVSVAECRLQCVHWCVASPSLPSSTAVWGLDVCLQYSSKQTTSLPASS